MVPSALSPSSNRPNQAWRWLGGGWRLAHRRPRLFVALSLWYLLLATLLMRLPFLGPLLLVLVTPALGAGAWLTIRDLRDNPVAPAAPTGGMGMWFRVAVGQPVQALLRALNDEQWRLPTIVLCLVSLGVVMALKIIEYVLIGGSMISALQSPEVMSSLRPVTMAAMAIIVMLTVLTTMSLFFTVPLVLDARLDAFAALTHSFLAAARRFVPLALFFAPFLALYAALAFLFTLNTYLGYFATFTLGPITLANFLGGWSCSYDDAFAASVPAAANQL